MTRAGWVNRDFSDPMSRLQIAEALTARFLRRREASESIPDARGLHNCTSEIVSVGITCKGSDEAFLRESQC